MAEQKTIGFVFIEGFADWEYGLLAASAVEWFGAKAVSLTPDGKPVKSMSGFRLTPDRSADPAENTDLDAVAVIGSDKWASNNPPDVAPLLKAVAEARRRCRRHLRRHACACPRRPVSRSRPHQQRPRLDPGERARLCRLRQYQDVPHAVAEGAIVSAPGSAPGTFALEFLRRFTRTKKPSLPK